MFKLFRFLKPYWWEVLILLAATIAQVFCTLQLPALMAGIINDGIIQQNVEVIWQIGGQMLLLAILGALCAFAASFTSARLGANFSRDVRAAIFTKVINFHITDVEHFSTASLINRTTTDIDQVQQTITMMLSLFLRAPLICIMSVIMAIQTAPDMAWIIVLSSAIIIGCAILIIALVMPKFKIYQKIVDKITLVTREHLTGLRVIRAFNNEKIEQSKFEQSNNQLTKIIVYIDKILELQNPMIFIVFNGTTLLCYWIGFSLLTQNYEYLGNMTAFAEYVTYVMMSFLMLSILFVMFPRANVSAGRINEILNTQSKVVWNKQTKGIPAKTPSVEFKNVDFRYNKAAENVLSNISFHAKAGQTTAFIGSTGSGKSTVVNLVPRFYEINSGEIIINGINIKNYAQDDLMGRVGFVPQHGILFSGTVRSNISFGAPNATLAQIKKAAEISQSKEFIEKLPEKYNYRISQGGSNVSGGQKQRLSIARAVCKDPDIFIFDDSFSALDMKTDRKLRTALQKVTQNSVVLIVAQRVSTIKDADQIVVLDNGKIVGKGTHYDLLHNCKVYNEIVKSQFSDQEYKKEMQHA